MSQKIKKLSCANNWISWILGLGIIPFFITRFFLMKWEYATCWWVTALFMIIPIAFLVWKVFYFKAYLKDIKAEGKKKLSVWLLSGSTALLISGAYFAIIGFYGLLNPYSYIIPLTLFMIIKVVGMIYDFLSNSEIFIGIKHDTFLGIALFIVYIFFAVNSTSNIMIYFAKILAIALSVLLTALVLKSCLLDKLSFKDHKTIMNFLLVALVAVGVSVYTIYLWLWKKNGAEQVLFSAVAGIYAAVLGGAITLGGVAWGIRNESKNRQEDLEKREEERKEEERKKYKPFMCVYQYPKGISINGKRIEGDLFEIPQNLKNHQDKNLYKIKIMPFAIKNSEVCSFFFAQLQINNDIIKINTILYVEKESTLFFYLPDIYLEEDINYMSLGVIDFLGNNYEIKLLYNQQLITSQADPSMRPYIRIEVKGNGWANPIEEISEE